MLTFRYRTIGGKPATPGHVAYLDQLLYFYDLFQMQLSPTISICPEDNRFLRIEINPPDYVRFRDTFETAPWETEARERFLDLIKDWGYSGIEEQKNFDGVLVWRPVSDAVTKQHEKPSCRA
jgi:hypothetical protein